MHLWKEKLGGDATYGRLMKTCLDHENAGCAVMIKKLWSGQQNNKLISELIVYTFTLIFFRNTE